MPSQARSIRGGSDEEARSLGARVVHAWGVLDRDRRLAAVAAVLLFATMLLPWYQQNAVVSASKSQPLVSNNLSAFGVFSFVEAAVLLVAVAVVFLLFARADGRSFHLPGGDGTIVFAAGIWTALLLVLRLFDKPGITHNGVAANVGVQWGIFFALAAAGLLALAGSRMRAGQRPEPPLVRRSEEPRRPREPVGGWPPISERPPRRSSPAVASEDEATVVTASRESVTNAEGGQGDEREVGPSINTERPRYPPAPATAAGRGPRPPRAPASNAEQLSFEESPETPDGR